MNGDLSRSGGNSDSEGLTHMLGTLGASELLIIMVICLLIFGPSRLPKMGKAIGETIKEFRNVGKELHGDDEDR